MHVLRRLLGVREPLLVEGDAQALRGAGGSRQPVNAVHATVLLDDGTAARQYQGHWNNNRNINTLNRV